MILNFKLAFLIVHLHTILKFKINKTPKNNSAMSESRIFDFAHFALKNRPKQDQLTMKINGIWQKTSTLQFVNQGNKISRGLLKLGISPGDKIALISTTNRTEWMIMDLGLSQIACINVPIYPTIAESDFEYIFNNAEIKYCFVSDEKLYHKIENIQDKVPSLVGIFTFDEVVGAPNWKEILDLGEDESTQDEVEQLSKAIKEDDLASIIYTSGTTGQPKGVLLTHKNIVSNVIASTPRIPIKSSDNNERRALSFLPICHIFERMISYLYLANGISIYYAESIDMVGANVKEVKPEYMTVVPRLVEKVYDKIYDKGVSAGGLKSKIFHWSLKIAEKYDLHKPKSFQHQIADFLVFKKWREGLGGNMLTLVSGSAALSSRLNTMFHAAGIPILEGYGLTETSPVISVNNFGVLGTKVGSVGRVLDNLSVIIAKDGEILVKGPSVTSGYYKDEEKTKEAFTSDGYFMTGDIGEIDSDGFLKITDRKKEMFKTSGGKYIAPQIIENIAKASKFIEQIMVVGDGEKMPCALVQPEFNFVRQWAERKGLVIDKSNQALCLNPDVKARIMKEIDTLNQTLGKWEQIKQIELTPELWTIELGVLTPTLKLKRKAIKERYINLYQKLYPHS